MNLLSGPLEDSTVHFERQPMNSKDSPSCCSQIGFYSVGSHLDSNLKPSFNIEDRYQFPLIIDMIVYPDIIVKKCNPTANHTVALDKSDALCQVEPFVRTPKENSQFEMELKYNVPTWSPK